MITKLKKQMTIHGKICDDLFKERFSYNKHDGEWNDKLYNNYITSKNRIDLLIELIEEYMTLNECALEAKS